MSENPTLTHTIWGILGKSLNSLVPLFSSFGKWEQQSNRETGMELSVHSKCHMNLVPRPAASTSSPGASLPPSLAIQQRSEKPALPGRPMCLCPHAPHLFAGLFPGFQGGENPGLLPCPLFSITQFVIRRSEFESA